MGTAVMMERTTEMAPRLKARITGLAGSSHKGSHYTRASGSHHHGRHK
jgi:hypothetical protein